MVYFSRVLDRIMTAGKLRNVELSRRSGVDEGTISRLRNASQNLDFGTLEKIVRHAADDDENRADLLAAFIKDKVEHIPGANLIHIGLREQPMHDEAIKDSMPPLPPDMQRAFRTLAANWKDENLRSLLVSLAEMFEPKKKKK